MSLKFIYLSFLFIIKILFSNNRDIYYSIDNSTYKQSNLMKEFNLTKSKFHFNKINFDEDLTIPDEKYIFSVIQSNPPQDTKFEIKEKNDTGSLNKLANYTIDEFIHNSNIFYTKLNDDYKRNILWYGDDKEKNIKKSKNKFACKINYTGIKYSNQTEELDNNNILPYKEVINFITVNFVLYENQPGIFIEKYLEGRIVNKTSLEKMLIKSAKSENFNFDKIKIKKLIQCFRFQRYNLIAIDEDNENLFIFQLTQETNQINFYNKDIKVEIELINVLKKSSLKDIDFNNINSGYLQVENNILILTEKNLNSSINILEYNSNDEVEVKEKIKEFKDPITNEYISFEIISTGFTPKVCFVVIKNYGVLYYNWKLNQYGLLFRHKKISHLDYYNYNKRNIGVYLSYNDSEIIKDESQEFFIELVKTDFLTEQFLNVNKIFYSKEINLFNPNDSLFDEYGETNFFISKKENKMYCIKRNLPFEFNNIDFKINLPEELKNAEFKMFNLVGVFKKQGDNGRISNDLMGTVKFQTEREIFSFFDFKHNEESEFVCKVTDKGKYEFTSEFGTSNWNDNSLFTTKKNIYLMGLPNNGGNFYFGIVILLLVFLALLIGGVIFKYKKRRTSIRNNDYMNLNYNRQ